MLSWFNISRLARRLGSISSSAKLPAAEAAIKEAITSQNTEAVREKLTKADLSTETWRALLTQAFEQKSSRSIKKALLQHPACVPQSALELAVRHNDMFIAARALRRGANPEHLTAGPDADGMRTLLTRVRGKNTLHPPHASHAQGPDLDRALRNIPGVIRDTSSFLRQAMQDKAIQSAWWDAAMEENRLDIQHAMLLRHADKNRNFRLLRGDSVTDEGMTENPYFSPKQEWLQNKQDWWKRSNQIASEEEIAAHVSYDTHAKYDYFKNHANPNPAPSVGENRTLTSGIENKKIGAATLFGVTALFFYMLVNAFFGDWKHLKEEVASRPERAQMGLPAVKNADGVPGLHLALENGRADAVKAFGELLERVPPEKRAELLAAKDADGVPGLYMALENGRADTIRAFGELLGLAPPEERAGLLAAKNADGVPGLVMALEYGRTDAVKAFGELLVLVPLEERAALLKDVKERHAAKVPGNTAQPAFSP